MKFKCAVGARVFICMNGVVSGDLGNFSRKHTGGALLDAGGYVLKYASMLLGETTKLVCAQSNYIKEFDVNTVGKLIEKNFLL